jgi:hypothetical protein
MATKSRQTMAKRAREKAVKDRRERKRAKKTETAAARAAAREEARHEAATGGTRETEVRVPEVVGEPANEGIGGPDL